MVSRRQRPTLQEGGEARTGTTPSAQGVAVEVASVGVDWARVALAGADDVGAGVVRLGVAAALVRSAVDDVADGELSAEDDAGALVGVVDGVEGEVVLLAEPSVIVPSVVVSEECEAPTSADTGRWPISSMPVTMPMATTKTPAVLMATRVHRGRRRAAGRRGSSAGGRVRVGGVRVGGVRVGGVRVGGGAGVPLAAG
jgi:hypothetical protein